MNILFVVPRSFNPKQMYLEYPIGVGILATLLKEIGYNVKIYDGNVESKEHTVNAFIDNFKPDVIGFSVITPNYPVAKQQIREIKELYPSIFLIAGGLHSTLFPDDLLLDGIDIVCLGEGESRISKILEYKKTNKNFSDIEGVAFKNEFDLVVKTPLTKTKTNLEELPFIDRNVFNLKKYTHHSMMASRGCPYKCKFCCNYTGTILQDGLTINSYTRVIEELLYLQNTFNAKEVFFADDIFLVKKKDILMFCHEYKRLGLKVNWIGQMRADSIDVEIAQEMASAGCKRIYFGVESGSDDILKDTNKRLNKKQLLAGINAAKNAGIRVKTGWIYGLPGTIQQQYESIDFMIEMRPHEISIHQLIPFPGTPYYDDSEKYGINIKNKKDFESFCYGGISDNISYDYITQPELEKLYFDTAKELEKHGYVSSDKATSDDEYIYSSPLSKESMTVFRKNN